MKKVFAVACVAMCVASFCACKKPSSTFRMKTVSYVSGNETITISAKELHTLIDNSYQPYGGLEDNYFFTLHFENQASGKAIFVFSELGEEFADVVADSFVVEQKSGGRISLVFTNGSELRGTKTKNTLTLSGNGVSYVFEKTK